MTLDTIFQSWLARQLVEWKEFEPLTDLVSVTPCSGPPDMPDPAPQRYIAEFRCRGLGRSANGAITVIDRFTIGIYFPDDHLRRVQPERLVTLLAPANVFHPNIQFPGVCPGHVRPGVGLVDLLYQVHSILTYQNANMNDFLNADAARWAREHCEEFPIDPRPLKRREISLSVEEALHP